MQSTNKDNNIEPQGKILDLIGGLIAGTVGGLWGAAIGWAFANAPYAGCWYACVAEGGFGQAQSCRDFCSGVF